MNRYCRIIGLCCLLLSTAAGASELCRWTDEDGVVHFEERCPEGIESEVLEFEDTPDVQDHTPPPRQAAEPGSQTRPTPEELREAAEKIAFDPVTSESQLHGCWKRIRPSAEQNPNYNRIEIYPFEEPQYQYFCYEAGGKLYTMMTNRQPDESPRRLKQRITALPSVERPLCGASGLHSGLGQAHGRRHGVRLDHQPGPGPGRRGGFRPAHRRPVHDLA